VKDVTKRDCASSSLLKLLPREKAVRSLIQVSAGIAVACGLFSSEALAAPPAAAAICAACHSANGTNGLGPSFKGLYGRKAGAGLGFTYSAAMRKAGMTWDDKSLDA